MSLGSSFPSISGFGHKSGIAQNLHLITGGGGGGGGIIPTSLGQLTNVDILCDTPVLNAIQYWTGSQWGCRLTTVHTKATVKIDDLLQVNLVTPFTEGDVISWNNTSMMWEKKAQGDVLVIDSACNTATNNDILFYDGITDNRWECKTLPLLAKAVLDPKDLLNVNIGNQPYPANSIQVWNDVSMMWELGINTALPAGTAKGNILIWDGAVFEQKLNCHITTVSDAITELPPYAINDMVFSSSVPSSIFTRTFIDSHGGSGNESIGSNTNIAVDGATKLMGYGGGIFPDPDGNDIYYIGGNMDGGLSTWFDGSTISTIDRNVMVLKVDMSTNTLLASNGMALTNQGSFKKLIVDEVNDYVIVLTDGFSSAPLGAGPANTVTFFDGSSIPTWFRHNGVITILDRNLNYISHKVLADFFGGPPNFNHGEDIAYDQSTKTLFILHRRQNTGDLFIQSWNLTLLPTISENWRKTITGLPTNTTGTRRGFQLGLAYEPIANRLFMGYGSDVGTGFDLQDPVAVIHTRHPTSGLGGHIVELNPATGIQISIINLLIGTGNLGTISTPVQQIKIDGVTNKMWVTGYVGDTTSLDTRDWGTTLLPGNLFTGVDPTATYYLAEFDISGAVPVQNWMGHLIGAPSQGGLSYDPTFQRLYLSGFSASTLLSPQFDVTKHLSVVDNLNTAVGAYDINIHGVLHVLDVSGVTFPFDAPQVSPPTSFSLVKGDFQNNTATPPNGTYPGYTTPSVTGGELIAVGSITQQGIGNPIIPPVLSGTDLFGNAIQFPNYSDGNGNDFLLGRYDLGLIATPKLFLGVAKEISSGGQTCIVTSGLVNLGLAPATTYYLDGLDALTTTMTNRKLGRSLEGGIFELDYERLDSQAVSLTLNELTDVVISAPRVKQYLRYSGGGWTNGELDIDLEDVGTGCPYETVREAYDAGIRRMRLVSFITETATVQTIDNVYIRMRFHEWQPEGIQLGNGCRVYGEDEDNTGIGASRIRPNVVATVGLCNGTPIYFKNIIFESLVNGGKMGDFTDTHFDNCVFRRTGGNTAIISNVNGAYYYNCRIEGGGGLFFNNTLPSITNLEMRHCLFKDDADFNFQFTNCLWENNTFEGVTNNLFDVFPDLSTGNRFANNVIDGNLLVFRADESDVVGNRIVGSLFFVGAQVNMRYKDNIIEGSLVISDNISNGEFYNNWIQTIDNNTPTSTSGDWRNNHIGLLDLIGRTSNGDTFVNNRIESYSATGGTITDNGRYIVNTSTLTGTQTVYTTRFSDTVNIIHAGDWLFQISLEVISEANNGTEIRLIMGGVTLFEDVVIEGNGSTTIPQLFYHETMRGMSGANSTLNIATRSSGGINLNGLVRVELRFIPLNSRALTVFV